VTPGKNRVAANAELHLAFDSFPVLQLFLPVDLGLLAEHDCSDECVSVVFRFCPSHSKLCRKAVLVPACTR
jgi:hypothetical protein